MPRHGCASAAAGRSHRRDRLGLFWPAICTSIGAGEPKFRIWLMISAGRKEKVVPGNSTGRISRRCAHIIGGGVMALHSG